MNSETRLKSLRDETFVEWSQARASGSIRLFVVTSGYESRSRSFAERVWRPVLDRAARMLVYGFAEYKTACCRPENDAYYKKIGVCPEIHRADEDAYFLEALGEGIDAEVTATNGRPLEVHIDYSCMPRRWYCRIPAMVQARLRPQDRCFMWYTSGVYPETVFPTAGVEDFMVFSGRPSLSARYRTHMFGLGFDKVRSAAIHSVLDPQNLICFYADPAADLESAKRVREDNAGILGAANYVLKVPLCGFTATYSMLASLVRDFRASGDVILVPDGPKPLILAASLIPITHYCDGVVCFHVTRGKGPNVTPVDVQAKGDPFGFSFSGVRVN